MEQKKKQVVYGALLAALAVLATQLYIDSETSKWKPRDLIEVAVAAHPIQAGTALGPALVKKREVPRDYAPVSAIPFSQIEELYGQNVAQDIVSEDYLTEANFAIRRTVGANLAEQILKDGMRAVTIPVTDTSSLSYSIVPGDIVDVIFSFNLPESGKQMTTVLLQGVPVITTGAYSADGAETGDVPQGYGTVTLQLSTEDALRLKFAERSGSIDLLLRRRSDSSTPALLPIFPSSFPPRRPVPSMLPCRSTPILPPP